MKARLPSATAAALLPYVQRMNGDVHEVQHSLDAGDKPAACRALDDMQTQGDIAVLYLRSEAQRKQWDKLQADIAEANRDPFTDEEERRLYQAAYVPPSPHQAYERPDDHLPPPGTPS